MGLEKRIKSYKALRQQCRDESEFIIEVAKSSQIMKDHFDSINEAYTEAIKEINELKKGLRKIFKIGNGPSGGGGVIGEYHSGLRDAYNKSRKLAREILKGEK